MDMIAQVKFTLLVTRWLFLGCKYCGRQSTPQHSPIFQYCTPMFLLRLVFGSKFDRVTTTWESFPHCVKNRWFTLNGFVVKLNAFYIPSSSARTNGTPVARRMFTKVEIVGSCVAWLPWRRPLKWHRPFVTAPNFHQDSEVFFLCQETGHGWRISKVLVGHRQQSNMAYDDEPTPVKTFWIKHISIQCFVVHFKDITSRIFGPLTSISLLEHSLVPQRLTASNRSVSLMTRSFSFTNINSVDSVMSSKGACDRESFVRHRIRFKLLSCQVQHFFFQKTILSYQKHFWIECLPLVKSLQTSLQIQGPCTHYRGWDPSTCIENTFHQARHHVLFGCVRNLISLFKRLEIDMFCINVPVKIESVALNIILLR